MKTGSSRNSNEVGSEVGERTCRVAEAFEIEPRLREAQKDETAARMFEIALRLEGIYKHASTHAAGIVIGNRMATTTMPLMRRWVNRLLSVIVSAVAQFMHQRQLGRADGFLAKAGVGQLAAGARKRVVPLVGVGGAEGAAVHRLQRGAFSRLDDERHARLQLRVFSP